jgi:hypothetical protein
VGLARDIYTALDSALAILVGERFALKIPRTAGALVLLRRRIRRANPFLRRGIVVQPALRIGIRAPIFAVFGGSRCIFSNGWSLKGVSLGIFRFRSGHVLSIGCAEIHG